MIQRNNFPIRGGLRFYAATIMVILCFLAFGCKPEPEMPPKEKDPVDTIAALDFITGMDMSYQPMLEDRGVVFKNEAGETIDDMMDYLKGEGVNLIRLRLFHTPDLSDPVMAASTLTQVVDMAHKVVDSGNNWLLDIHYADTWADPGNQPVPAAWQGLSVALLRDSVFEYTLRVMGRLAEANVLPQMVQIGNETNDGFLWDQGRAWGQFAQYATLVNAGLEAVSQIAIQEEVEIKTMIHISGVVDKDSFYQSLIAQNVEFDIIGLSHYSRWHNKDLTIVESELKAFAAQFEKPILIVETAYPWTLGWNDWTNNLVGGDDHLVDNYPATAEGQAAYLKAWADMLKAIPENRGLGFVWWAPDYVAFDGPQSNNGSPWENMTTFDFDNEALPVMGVFKEY
ncbi:MAG: arabinogalactan endo-beta-1,4-galactanase [Bacteroidia bacterium]